MKKVLKVILVMLTITILTGCGKTYEKTTYTDYEEYFNKKDGYIILDKSKNYDINVRRYLEAGNGNVQVFYIEYATEEDAIDYIKGAFSNEEGYKVKLKDNYSYVKNTKDRYQKIYRVDNVVINVLALNKEYKKDVKNILKDLGY